MKKVYSVALIGCGHIGNEHIEEIYYRENVSIKYVCDLDINKAELFKKKYSADIATTDFNECVTSCDVDIVIIATYPSSHLEILKKCIENKKHVICEKPISTDYEKGKEFVDLVKQNPDCKVLIGHILRHNTTYKKIGEMIKDGAIGSPIIMRMVQNHHTMDWQKYLKLIKETSPIIDCGVHYIDVMQWFTNSKIVHISGIGLRTEKDVPNDKYNYGLITARLSDGSVGYYEAGWSNTMASENIKEFIGPKGRIKLVYRKDRQTHSEEGDLVEYYKYPEKTYEMINIQSKRKPTYEQFSHLIKMIEDDVPSLPTIDEVFDSFCVALEADEKIRLEMKYE